MVLQRDVKTPVWGWADPGEKVIVEIDGQIKTTVADSLPPTQSNSQTFITEKFGSALVNQT